MKNIFSISVVCFIILFSIACCKKKGTDTIPPKEIIEIPITRTDTTTLQTSIPPLPGSTVFKVVIDTFATKVDEFIGPYGYTKDEILKVNLTALNMVLESTTGQTFNFIKDTLISLKVYVDSFNGVLPKLVATKTSIPLNATNVTFDVIADDIKDYFRADYMKIIIEFRNEENQGLDASSVFRVNYTFKISVQKP